MKKSSLTTVILVLLMIGSNVIQAQTAEVRAQPDQLKLMEQWLGNWQEEEKKDSILVIEFVQYGKAFVETDYRLINGKKSFYSMWSYSFSPEDDKFRIFALYPNGNSYTWLGSFTSEKKWVQELVQNFSPEKVLGKAEILFDTPTHITASIFNAEGVKTAEEKAIKIKQ